MATGLTSSEARRRLEAHGPNRLPRPAGPSWAKLLRHQIAQPLIYVLLGAAAVSGALEQWVEVGVILGVVVANAAVGLVQERRANQAIESLLDLVAPRCTVVRDARRLRIPAEKVVPGDLLVLAAGDKVAADARVEEAHGLLVDESLLSGESAPVGKLPASASPASAAEPKSSDTVFAGTLVATGQGQAVTLATGAETELARIAALVSAAEPLATPLTRKVASFGRTVTWAILAVAALTFGIALVRDYGVVEGFLAAVALAVAAIPEGLPAIMTIALAVGAHRMAARKAVVRRLPAVETLGSTTVICSDKTGTLTRNEMVAVEAFADSAWQLPGTGREVEGSAGDRDPPGPVARLLEAGLLCSDARLVRRGERTVVEGDPTEGALLLAAARAGIGRDEAERAHPRVDELPFDAERRFMATVHGGTGKGRATAILKGAPEAVVSRCSSHAWDGPWDRHAALREASAMAARGLRVLAVARKPGVRADTALSDRELADCWTLLGLVGLLDPPREEALRAVAACRAAGIRVVMITGDHPRTAAAVAGQLGFSDDEGALTGEELDLLSDEELDNVAARRTVFARVSPEHKLRLVSALQGRGEIAAMTGDGVNDAAALRQADIGVAMGVSGTDVSKEAADMVLRDDNFATIAAAVEEGRRVYDNLIKSIVFILPTSAGVSLLVLGAIALGLELPVLPVQVLWINLITTVTLALPLAVEAREPDTMQRPPRHPDEPVLGRMAIRRIGVVGVLMFVLGVVVFELETGSGASLDEARSAVVAFVVLLEAFYLLNCRSLRSPLTSIGLTTNKTAYGGILAVLALQLGFTYLPPLQAVFDSAALDPSQWAWAILLAALVLPVVALDKRRARAADVARVG